MEDGPRHLLGLRLQPGRPSRGTLILAAYALALGLAPFVVNGLQGRQSFGPPCVLRAVTGVPCPTCGLTTAFRACARGQLVAALEANPLGPFLFVVCLAFPAGVALAYLGDRRLVPSPGARWPRRLPLALGIVLLLMWFYQVYDKLIRAANL